MILSTAPVISQAGEVGGRAVLECRAEGSPPPSYTWLHSLAGGRVRVRGKQARLVLERYYKY